MATADAAPALSARLGAAGGAGRRRPRPPQPALLPEAVAFQDALEELLSEPPPPLLRGGHWLLMLLFLALVAGAALLRVDVVVKAEGRLTVDGPPLVLQPLERSVIREIRVRPGEVVRQGQVLALLDPSFTEADRAALVAEARRLRAEVARLEAEQSGHPFATGPGAPQEMLLQAILLASRRGLRAARLRGFAAEEAALEASLRGLEEGQARNAEMLAIAREVEDMRARLTAARVGSRLQQLAARADVVRAQQEERASRHRIEELRHSLAARRAERAAFEEEWQRATLAELATSRAALARVEESLAKAARADELTRLVAPADGVVLEVARRSAGSVLREAEPLITVVPSSLPLIGEINLRSADIGQVREGDPVVLKVDAFPYQRHGALRGVLRSVAQDSASRPEDAAPGRAEGARHRGHVVLEQTALRHLPPGARLVPGMTLAAELKVGERSLLRYFLEPLQRGLQESLREP